MKITHQRTGDTLVIAVADELGHHEAREIIDYMGTVLALYPAGPVVLDLSALKFMDSSGLAVVLNLHRALLRAGRSLCVRGTPPQAMRVFQAANLPHIVTFEMGE
ncbi:STAS domain-containing protein [Intestinibacillus massiliensis]|uniref:STAS domain-containing protein n=1 Tax=Intestinibacillus massiliensis TaxID=1871029 RepID=UPI000B364394|nr:STAS domain-containing protein [Intestinibacillus massiliensis]